MTENELPDSQDILLFEVIEIPPALFLGARETIRVFGLSRLPICMMTKNVY